MIFRTSRAVHQAPGSPLNDAALTLPDHAIIATVTYRVRVYCETSAQRGSCDRHEPPHPFIAPRTFESIRAANEYGEELVAEMEDDDLEWEVIDEDDTVVE